MYRSLDLHNQIIILYFRKWDYLRLLVYTWMMIFSNFLFARSRTSELAKLMGTSHLIILAYRIWFITSYDIIALQILMDPRIFLFVMVVDALCKQFWRKGKEQIKEEGWEQGVCKGLLSIGWKIAYFYFKMILCVG